MIQQILKKREDYLNGRYGYIPVPDCLGDFTTWYPGIPKGEYLGITGGTSSAKTQFTKFLVMFNAIEFFIRNKINGKVLWYGLEESVEEARYSLLSYLCYRKDRRVRYNIEHFESVGKTIFESDIPIVQEMIPVMEKFWEYIIFRDSIDDSVSIYEDILAFAESRGQFFMVKSKDGVETRTPVKEVKFNSKWNQYIADDSSEIVVVVVDHMGIMEQTEGEKDDAQSMSRLSKLLRKRVTKLMDYIAVGVIQQMAGMEDLDHVRSNQVYASLQGFGDNKRIARDMTTILGITNIFRYQITIASTNSNIGTKGKVNIEPLGDFQRVVGILKRRFGVVGKRCLFYFDGCVGSFEGITKDADIDQFKLIMSTHRTGLVKAPK